MQFDFVPRRGTTGTIFNLRQLQENTHCANRPPSRAFVDLEKAYDCAPSQVLLWLLRSLCAEEWAAVRAVQGMYCNGRSRVRLNGQNIEELNDGVGVHQVSVLSPLLFSVVLEGLSQGLTQRERNSWDIRHADDLALKSDKTTDLYDLWRVGVSSST